MRTDTVITIRTTAAHTVLTDNVTLTDHPDIPPVLAIIKPDSIVVVIVITMALNAEVHTTIIVRAFRIVTLQKRLALAKILADITTSASIDVFTI